MLVAKPSDGASEGAHAFDVRRCSAEAIILRDQGGEQLSISNGAHRIGIFLRNGSFLNGPVNLTFVIRDDDGVPTQLRALARFRSFRGTGGFGACARPEPHARHWLQQLRAFDAVVQGASEREIALVLFPGELAKYGWRDNTDLVRSAVRRLIATSRRLVDRDYLKLLR